METTGAFKVLAEEQVDESLTLQLSKGSGMPRLCIVNMGTDKKKYTTMAWAEGQSRSLKIKAGRNKTKEYSMNTIRRAVSRLIKTASSDLDTKALEWRAVQVLNELVHRPRSVYNESECMAVPETKRDTLWLAYAPTPRDPHMVRPCFHETGKNKAILSKYLIDGTPWPALPTQGALPPSMRNHPCVKELIFSESSRWGDSVKLAAFAMTMGFKDWSPDGEQILGEAMWKVLPTQEARSDDSMAVILASGRDFFSRMIAYIRLKPLLSNVSLALSEDAVNDMEADGIKRRERFNYLSRPDHSRTYVISRYADAAKERAAFTIVPENRLPGEKDKIYRLTEKTFDTVLEACSLGGEADGQYAVSCLIWAMEMDKWLGMMKDIQDGTIPEDSVSDDGGTEQ